MRERRLEPAFYSRPEGLTSEKREILLERIRSHLESLPVLAFFFSLSFFKYCFQN